MEILARSRLSSKEQLSLPAAIRRLLGIQAGDELVWMRDEEGRLLVQSARPNTLADIRTAIAASGVRPVTRPVTLEEMKKGIAARMKDKHGRR